MRPSLLMVNAPIRKRVLLIAGSVFDSTNFVLV